ncbi:MAG TPA: hypothetical protein VMI12_10335 [Puia sp.]|nr:hypothetical protein [Puia sp.]
MKKTNAVIAILSAYFLVLSINGFAQLRTDKSTIPGTETLLTTAALSSQLLHDNAIVVSAYDVNSKALRDFKKNFKNVTNEVWYSVPGGYDAEFTEDDIKNSVVYNKEGRWEYTIQRYGEDKLPDEIRSIVKSQYYDYSISTVDEIHVDQKPIYIVHMQDKDSWKNVRVYDGEMTVIEDFNKKEK